MAEKKDRRSRADMLRDGIIGEIRKSIEVIEAGRVQRLSDSDMSDNMDKAMISILRNQIETINALCKKNGKGEKSAKTT